MKKILFTLLICVLFAAGLVSCEKKDAQPETSLNDRGMEIVSLMDEMVRDEGWVAQYGFLDSKEYGKKLRNGDYTEPSVAYEISFPEGPTTLNVNLSDKLYDYYVRNYSLPSFVNNMNGAAGNEALAAASIFSAQSCFVNRSTEGNRLYLYVFDEGYPIAVIFHAGENGAYRATGHFILNESFAVDSSESIENSINITGVTVTKIENN